MSEHKPTGEGVDGDETDVFQSWDAMLENIKGEVTRLAVNRHIFWEVQEIIKANERIQKPSSFYEWLGNVYATDAVIGVRRQLDRDKRSISFTSLFEGILVRPSVLSRERFVALYCDKSNSDVQQYLEEQAHEDFEKFASPGSPYIDPVLVASDLSTLQDKAKNIGKYANKRVAHFDREALDILPTFHELNECIDFLEVLLKKYMLLFRAVGYVQVLPVWQYDWKAIFREPWLEPIHSG